MQRLIDIWKSFLAIPTWVKIWVVVILVPANMASLLFLDQPSGGLIAALAIGGMALNGPIMWVDRGLSKLMSLPHLLLWGPLMVVLWPQLGAPYPTALFVINAISLAFDAVDFAKWLRGDRQVAAA